MLFRRLEKLLNQHDDDLESAKLNMTVDDEIPENDCVQKLANDVVVIVVESAIGAEHEENNVSCSSIRKTDSWKAQKKKRK